jgi:uncharacterized protein YbjT (DUF2867 family)
MKRALILGATGLVGNALLNLLLESDRYSEVVAVVRNPLAIAHPKLHVILTDFKEEVSSSSLGIIDDVFCCLGTNFYWVDYTLPVQWANLTHIVGAKQLLIVSALGADAKSSLYYNQVKGQVEDAIQQIGFQTLHIMRPSLLLGDRSEQRFGEDAAKIIYKYLGFLIPSKYKGIHANTVAKAMLHEASREVVGTFIHESKNMQRYK